MFETIHEAAEAVRLAKVTPIELVEQCFEQIDRWEKHVHAWVFVDRERALDDARRLTDELKAGRHRGPLHGIPLGIKDIFDVADWPTAAGSARWAGSVARNDAEVVARLRAAGAVFLGKTVTTQFASFDPPVTKNPWNLARTPGGSSSGSAVAVATRMCLGALGSQTGGSISRPASYCGVLGCKPAYGRLPLDGVVPLAHSMDHPGPITRCVLDLAILRRALSPFQRSHDLIEKTYRFEAGLQAPTIDIVRGMFYELADPSIRAMVATVAGKLRDKGANLDEFELPVRFAEVLPRHRTVMAVEAAQFHEDRLRRHPEDYLPRIKALLQEGLVCSAPEYARCKEHQALLRQEMLDAVAPASVLLTPATTSPAPLADTTGSPAFNSPWSYVGLPTVSLPTGVFADGLPLAIQLVGRSEEDLFATAAWVERALGVKPLTPPLPR